jgi:hypothetical protein
MRGESGCGHGFWDEGELYIVAGSKGGGGPLQAKFLLFFLPFCLALEPDRTSVIVLGHPGSNKAAASVFASKVGDGPSKGKAQSNLVRHHTTPCPLLVARRSIVPADGFHPQTPSPCAVKSMIFSWTRVHHLIRVLDPGCNRVEGLEDFPRAFERCIWPGMSRM